MHLLVVLQSFFMMMEDGLYQVSKLKVILLHLMQINSLDEDDNEEVVLECLIRFWQKAMGSWLPQQHCAKVCKQISDFLINKAFVSMDPKIKDFCITKLAIFVNDL